MTRRITTIVVLVAIAALVLYNIFILIEPTPNDTISYLMFDWGRRYPTVPLVIGVLCGHWFWPPRKEVPAFGPWILLVWGIIFAGLDWGGYVPDMPAVLPLLVGIGMGAWLWGWERKEVT